MLDHLAVAIAAVTAWEAGRIIIRTVRPVPAPVAVAEPEPEPAELADVRAGAAAAAALIEPPAAWTAGWDIFQFARRGRVHDIRHLPAHVRDWARGLTDESLAALAASLPARIDRHLARRATIRGVPHVPPVQPMLSLRDVVERSGRSGGGPRMGR
ncbi:MULTISPECIES: hypothetical protein [unclassified Methylobacterium]|uniref:hypothetical protein n=1 Tax=unclassified Methylobacterium TaxID=2615210 RepID=UPI0006AEEEC1|nr:hypothetical protein ADL19_04370 [Streptomyces purpurogeneiscleroticus]